VNISSHRLGSSSSVGRDRSSETCDIIDTFLRHIGPRITSTVFSSSENCVVWLYIFIGVNGGL